MIKYNEINRGDIDGFMVVIPTTTGVSEASVLAVYEALERMEKRAHREYQVREQASRGERLDITDPRAFIDKDGHMQLEPKTPRTRPLI